jgi:glycosyltransferase involved in cell wall biosynthesis
MGNSSVNTDSGMPVLAYWRKRLKSKGGFTHLKTAGKDSLPITWLVFADDKRPFSMRMVLGMHLAQIDPVVIVEPAVSVFRTRSISPLKRRSSPIADTKSWHYHPLHFPEKLPGISSIANGLNRWLIQREINRLAPEGSMRIACYDSPSQHYLAGKLGETIGVYLAIDDRTLSVTGEPIEGEVEAEKRLLGKVDKVVCVSEFLAGILETRIPADRSIPIHVLPNGYDNNLFDPNRVLNRPDVLADVPRPVILVAGHVSERIDWDGISAASQARPEWTWLFVGPSDTGIPEKINALERLNRPSSLDKSPRFILKAPIPLEQIPDLISHCDVCAVPYRLNSFTMASSPLKGIEYLAMGAPVLSTRVPSLLRYGTAIQWVEQGSGESYAAALDRLKAEQKIISFFEARRLAVLDDSHEARVQQFRRIVFDKN